jgi:hypothetical protein
MFPTFNYVYGRSYLTLSLLNLPETIRCENVHCGFMAYGSAECVSVDFEYDGEISKSRIVLRTPRVSYPGEIVPSLIFVFENRTVPVDVTYVFTYMEPPRPFVISVAPSISSISKSTLISLSIKNFPPVDGLDEIVALFTWPNSSKRSSAIVEKFISVSETSNHELYLNISSPRGNGARSGQSDLTIYHKFYPNYTAKFEGFSFVDTSNPLVSQLRLIGYFAVADSLRVPMSKPQTIFVSVDDAPANFDDIGCTAQIQGNRVKTSSSAYTPETRSATVALEVGPPLSAGLQYGMLVFSDPPSSCNSLCCADRSCHEPAACGEIKTACFLLDYFDDTLPRISNRYKSFGYIFLGFRIYVFLFVHH